MTGKEEPVDNLKKQIVQIVDEHSGGLKGLELMTALIEKNDGQLPLDGPTFYDEIAKEVETIPELGLLHYGMKLDDEVYREKIFIYRKIGVPCDCRKEGEED